MRILVTGAEGFIGSHLVETLVKQGYNVRAFVMYNFNDSLGWIDYLDNKILKNIEIFRGDIRDNNCVDIASKNCNYIFHLAALIGIPYSYVAIKSYLDTNIIGTLNILQSSLKNNIDQVICTSTSEVYGNGQYFPMDENHALNAQSPYAASKIGADQLALSFYHSFSLPVTVLRPFNTFGPRQSNRAIIPTIITQLKHGKIIELGSINTKRDFTYVDDTVDGFIKCIKTKNAIGEIINLGTGYDISIKNLFDEICEILNIQGKIILKRNRRRPNNSEVDKLQSSNKKAKKILKWVPKYIHKKGLQKGLHETIKWFQKEENIKKYNSQNYVI